LPTPIANSQTTKANLQTPFASAEIPSETLKMAVLHQNPVKTQIPPQTSQRGGVQAEFGTVA
jgi:hypothetical protein